MDRIDLYAHLSRMSMAELQNLPTTESSHQVAERAYQAQQRQYARQSCLNAKLSGDLLEQAAR